MEASPNNNIGGSPPVEAVGALLSESVGSLAVNPPLSKPVASKAITISQMEDQTDPNPDERDFWGEMNKFVLTLAGGGAIAMVFSKISPPPSSRSSDTFHVIAASDGVAFMSSFIGYVLGDKNPDLVKAFTFVGAAAGVFVVNVALAEFFFPKHAILVGAIASIPPVCTLIKRGFNFKAYVPTLPRRITRPSCWSSPTGISYGT